MNVIDSFKVSKTLQRLDRLEAIIYALFGISLLILLGIWNNNLQENILQQDISKQIIRFHVIANSDSSQDQQLKLKIKDRVVEELQQDLSLARNIADARKIILSKLETIELISNKVMEEEGYHYNVRAELAQVEFPAKVYGDLTFPPGEYEALRIEIGEAKGKNWWCVMFPSLCFVDESYSVVPEESKDKLKHVLTEEEYDLIQQKEGTSKAENVGKKNQECSVVFKFKITEWWNKLINK